MDVKQHNESRLTELGIRVNQYLPPIEPIEDFSVHTAIEIVTRAYVLSNVIGIGYGRSGDEILDKLIKENLEQALTPNEKNFLVRSNYTEREKALTAWNIASVHGLAWALGLEEMNPLTNCPDSLASHFLPAITERACNAMLRPLKEIYMETDFYYRFHWAARDARLHNQPFPRPEIEVAMRRKSLEWATNTRLEWDDISLDT
jgi:hypothetical protein